MKSFFLLPAVSGLHVMQLLDSVILEKNEYLQLSNFNEANFVSQDEGAFNQTITVSIANNFANFMFDIFVFEIDEEGKSPDFDCYKNAVYSMQFNTDCKFGTGSLTTDIFTNVETRTYDLKTGKDSNDKDKLVIIDNTPFPLGGAYANSSISL